MNAITRQPTNFEISLQEYEPQLAAVLPSHISIEKFKRVIITAVNANPDLAGADRRSLFTSCVKAAQDGLLPDGREAALVIFNTKVKRNGREEWVKLVQYMPMIHGIRKRMRNTKEVASADAQVVYANDEFDYRLGDDPMITHRPTMGDRGQPIGAYAIIKLANGEVLREVMSIGEIEKVRSISRAKDKGPWVDFWGEMARKTVLRRCSKAAPTSSDLDHMLQRDDEAGGTTIAHVPARPRRRDFTPPAEPEAPRTREVKDQIVGFPGDDEPDYEGDIANEVSTDYDRQTGEVR